MTDKDYQIVNASKEVNAEAKSSEQSINNPRSSLSRRGLLRNVAGASALTLGGGLLGTRDAAALTARTAATTSFTIAVLPDTQFYSRYATPAEGQEFQTRYGTGIATPFNAQTQFIVNNAAKYNIVFTTHLGDLVDQSQPNMDAQWSVADVAMQNLDKAKLPYSFCAGNHDVIYDYEYTGPADQSSGTDEQRAWWEPYLHWFPASRAAQQSTYLGSDATGWHQAHAFTVFGVRIMVISLSWRASNQAIAWANQMIANNPTLPVILVSHQLINIAPDFVSPLEVPYGQMLWSNLIANNDQIFMTLNGHYHGGAHLQKINNFGNPVDLMVVDYQMSYQGGNGLMRLYEFDFSNNKIDVVSFSPWVVQKPANTLNQFDQAWLTESNHQFSLPINFQKRFSRFMKFSPIMSTTGTPILPRVQQDLVGNFTEPATPVMVPPANVNDYPVIPQTVAHWRPVNFVAGQTVPVGGVLTDLTGQNSMTRAALSGNGWTGSLNDVVWSSDAHYLSSAAGSVQFLNTNKTTSHFNFFSTTTSAPINAMTFANGYTIEAFIKFDNNWSASNNAWSNIMSRLGQRGNLPNYQDGQSQSPPILFAISNLGEVQWSTVPSTNTSWDSDNWSGEIFPGIWYHVAIVNDPVADNTILYVEGAPVMRNASGSVGIATCGANFPWVIGATSWLGAMSDGWFGNLGEIRICSVPLQPTQWLTARRQSS
jgi:hypothetical protein